MGGRGEPRNSKNLPRWAAEFGKRRRGIWHNLPRKTVGPTHVCLVLMLIGSVGFRSLIKWVSNVLTYLCRSTLLSRPNKVGLKCLYVRPSTKTFFDFSEIWHVDSGRWVMHDGMQYDPVQGQGHDPEPLKVGNPFISKSYLLHHLQWELATDHWFLN